MDIGGISDFFNMFNTVQGWILFIVAFLLGIWAGHLVMRSSSYNEDMLREINMLTQSPLY